MTGMELRVGNKYRLGRKIGSGSFGDIYLGIFFILNTLFSCCYLNYAVFGHGKTYGVMAE